MNRRIISQIASLHFAPTKLAKENLINSGVKKNIFLTGNTVVDALSMAAKLIKKITLVNLILKKINTLSQQFIEEKIGVYQF